MALTPEVLSANESLKGLTDEQVAAVVTLSTNDENKVIGIKTGEIYGQLDRDILTSSGVEKIQGEKSYDYAKRVLGEFKTKAESSTALETQINEQKKAIGDLEKQIKEGAGDKVLAQKLVDAEDRLGKLQTQYTNEKKSWETEKGTFDSKLKQIRVDAAFAQATPGLKFKAGYPENVQKVLIRDAQRAILEKNTPDWLEDGTLILRDDKGMIVTNPADLQKPHTIAGLMRDSLKDVLESTEQKSGGGTNPPGGGAPTVEVADLAAAKTQNQASDIIAAFLAQKGVAKTSPSYHEEQTKLWNEYKISSLPIR